MKSNFKKLTAIALALSTFTSIPSAFATKGKNTDGAVAAAARDSKSLAETVTEFQNLQPGVFFIDSSLRTIDPTVANQVITQIIEIFKQYPAIKNEFVRQMQSVNPSAQFVINTFDDDAFRLTPLMPTCLYTMHCSRSRRSPQPPVTYSFQDGKFVISVNRQLLNMSKALGIKPDLSELKFVTAHTMGHLIDTTICCHEDPTLLPYITHIHLNKNSFSCFIDPMRALTADDIWSMASEEMLETYKEHKKELEERKKEFDDMHDRMLDISVKNLNEIADREKAESGKSLNHVEKSWIVELCVRSNSYDYEPQLTFNCLNDSSFSKRFANGFACAYSDNEVDHTEYSKALHEWLKLKDEEMAASK